MEYKYQFNTEEEKQNIINNNADKILIIEANVAEGNFLTFSDFPRLEDRITTIEDTQDLILLKLNGVIV